MFVQIAGVNGIKESKVLNALSSSLKKKYSPRQLNIKFEMGFDGIWELIVHHKRNNRALVFKEHDGRIICFIYSVCFEGENCQPNECHRADNIHPTLLLSWTNKVIDSILIPKNLD
jgi:hypothetical protein